MRSTVQTMLVVTLVVVVLSASVLTWYALTLWSPAGRPTSVSVRVVPAPVTGQSAVPAAPNAPPSTLQKRAYVAVPGTSSLSVRVGSAVISPVGLVGILPNTMLGGAEVSIVQVIGCDGPTCPAASVCRRSSV